MRRPLKRAALATLISTLSYAACEARDERPGHPGTPDVSRGDAGDASPADAALDRPTAHGEEVPPDFPADAGLPSELAWLADATLWRPIEGSEFTWPMGQHYESVTGAAPFPQLSWVPCGNGCDDLAGHDVAFQRWDVGAVSSHQIREKRMTMVSLRSGYHTASEVFSVSRVVDLDRLTSSGAVLKRSPESANIGTGLGNANAMVGSITGASRPNDPTEMMYMALDVTTGRRVFSRPRMLVSDEPFALAAAILDDPLVDLGVGSSALRARLDVTSSAWTVLDERPTGATSDGDGDLGVWYSQDSGEAELRAWSPTDGKGVRTLLSRAPEHTCDLSLDPGRIVGVQANASLTQAARGCMEATEIRFWKLPRRYGLGPEPEFSPPLLVPPSTITIESQHFGDHAIALVSTAGTYWLLIARLSDWRMWRFDLLASNNWPRVQGISDRYVYWAERNNTAFSGSGHGFQVLRRIDLTKLDLHARPLTTGPLEGGAP